MTKKSELNFAAIYLIRNIRTGTVYVGQAINVRKRWARHRGVLRRNQQHRNQKLQRAWNKYGEENFINHSKEYVRGIVHTNTIESFWAIVKRGVIGQYHKVSAKYLNKYLDEFCFRYNARFCEEDFTFGATLEKMLGI